mgnify:CR=1 FL=1
MNWKKDKFTIIKKAIDPDMAEFLKNYLLLKRKVLQTFMTTRYLSEFNTDWGTWKDAQVPGTYSHYADIAMETLLTKLKPIMEKTTQTKLYENYSYTRIYKLQDILKRHKDRFSCEISTTLNLGSDHKWPIYINPKEKEGNLNPGDMLVYRGDLLEHWREEYTGNYCVQVFLHYNNKSTKGAEENALDRRPHLGLPSRFKRSERKIPK